MYDFAGPSPPVRRQEISSGSTEAMTFDAAKTTNQVGSWNLNSPLRDNELDVRHSRCRRAVSFPHKLPADKSTQEV